MKSKRAALLIILIAFGQSLMAQFDVCKNLKEVIENVEVKESFKNIRQALLEEKLSGNADHGPQDTIRKYACHTWLNEIIPGYIEYNSFFGGGWKFYTEYIRTTDDAQARMDYWLWRNQVRKCLEDSPEWTFKEITEKQYVGDDTEMKFTADKEMENTLGFRHIIVEVVLKKEMFSNDYVVKIIVH